MWSQKLDKKADSDPLDLDMNPLRWGKRQILPPFSEELRGDITEQALENQDRSRLNPFLSKLRDNLFRFWIFHDPFESKEVCNCNVIHLVSYLVNQPFLRAQKNT